MAKEGIPVRVDWLDAVLAETRMRIIIKMADSGQLDPDSAAALYERTTRPDVVAEDRAAAEKNDFGPDSPSGRLATLYFKLARRGDKRKI